MGLISHYRFDSDVKDALGYANGSAAGSTSFVTGKIGNALDYNSSSAITMTFPEPLNKYQFSISYWVRGTGTPISNFRGVWILYDEDNTVYWRGDTRETTNDYILHYVKDYAISSWASVIAINNSDWTSNDWYHVAMTYDHPVAKTYKNGSYYSAVNTSTKDLEPYKNMAKIVLNSSGTNTLEMDDFKIFDHILSEKEIANLGRGKSLHYSFNTFQEPTTNLINPDYTASYGTGTYSVSATSDGWYRAHCTRTHTNNYVFRLDLESVPNGATYTWSIEFISPTGNFKPQLTGSVGVGELVNVSGDKWERTWTNTTGVARSEGIYWKYNATDTAMNEYIFYRWYQVEAKDHSTPFVYGSRTGIVLDDSGSGFDSVELAESTTPEWTSDSSIGEGCYQFDGDVSQIIVPSGGAMKNAGTSQRTICCWCYFDDNAVRDLIFGAYNSVFNFNIERTTGNYLRFYWNGSPDTTVTACTLPQGQWIHIAVSYDVAVGYEVYKNGSSVYTYSTPLTSDSGDADFRWGRDTRTGTTALKGRIADARVYNTVLSDGDVLEIYQQRGSIDSVGNFHTLALRETGHQPLVLDYTNWTLGTGSVTGFSLNGLTSENTRITGGDPWGNETIIWEASPSGDGSADGGWNTSNFNIDNTKMYRYSCWFWRNRAMAVSQAGASYFGCHGYGTVAGVLGRDSGSNSTNPYFLSGYSVPAPGEWELWVAHIWPAGSGTGSNHDESGRYTIGEGKIGSITRDYVWRTESTSANQRSYCFYDTLDPSLMMRFLYPRVDVIDGTEPTIADLLSGSVDSQNYDYIYNKGGDSYISLDVGAKNTHIGKLSEVGPINGIEAYYKLDGNLVDLTGNNSDGTNDGATIKQGLGQRAYYFDGTGTTDGATPGSNIIINEGLTNTSVATYPDGCTYSIWINVDTTAVDRMAVFWGAGTIKHIEIYSSGKYFRTEAATQNGYSFGTGTFPDTVRGTWSHFAIVFANLETNRPVRWYQNGTLFHTGYMVGGTDPDQYFSFSRLGRSTGSGSYLYAKSFHGLMQDFRIYNNALTAEEIKIMAEVTNPSADQKVKIEGSNFYPNGQILEI